MSPGGGRKRPRAGSYAGLSCGGGGVDYSRASASPRFGGIPPYPPHRSSSVTPVASGLPPLQQVCVPDPSCPIVVYNIDCSYVRY